MRRIAAATAVVLVVILVLGIAQLVLPGIAAQRIRNQLKGTGRVLSVDVSAFPAIELLWTHADSVNVRMASYRSGAVRLQRLLNQAGDVGTLRVSAASFSSGLLTVHDARLLKRGNVLTASARVEESDLERAIPLLRSVTPASDSSGQLVLEGRADVPVLGEVRVPVVVQPRDGELIAAPDIPLVGSFFTFTLFADRHVRVQSVSASPDAGGFMISARALLH
jgi:hypothetical protein